MGNSCRTNARNCPSFPSQPQERNLRNRILYNAYERRFESESDFREHLQVFVQLVCVIVRQFGENIFELFSRLPRTSILFLPDSPTSYSCLVTKFGNAAPWLVAHFIAC